jgi:hypothetical protein
MQHFRLPKVANNDTFAAFQTKQCGDLVHHSPNDFQHNNTIRRLCPYGAPLPTRQAALVAAALAAGFVDCSSEADYRAALRLADRGIFRRAPCAGVRRFTFTPTSNEATSNEETHKMKSPAKPRQPFRAIDLSIAAAQISELMRQQRRDRLARKHDTPPLYSEANRAAPIPLAEALDIRTFDKRRPSSKAAEQ